MFKKIIVLQALLIFIVFGMTATAQMTPWKIWTFLSADQMDEIIGEASGETAFDTIMATGGFNRDRLAEEYAGTFLEAQYVYDKLKLYGLQGAEIVRLKVENSRFGGSEVWDGIKGELWETNPRHQKLASYQDLRQMLVGGSNSADVTAELVWVGRGTEAELKAVDVTGKIVVTEGNVGGVHQDACMQMGALGVVAISQSRPYFDPLQLPLSGIRGDRQSGKPAKFAFILPVREGDFLKRRLLEGETITVHAVVESKMEPYDLEDPTCFIPGSDPDAGEIIFSAHLFEGYIKQGANDNLSGSAAILEVARTLNTLIKEGRLPQPKRTIRFIWGPEFSGIGPWVQKNKELMEKTLCDINMDMVGEALRLNKSYMTMMRTTYGNPHYVNDVMENYFRFIGEGNHERVQNRRNADLQLRRIVAPSGNDEPFYYSIETHYGSSDHEVFNDWGVQVPGIMMIAWPDQWYHTSGDRPDKSDPTQLKRVVIIGAATAYTIASADDDMANRIAAETESNAVRRLGHKLAIALEVLNDSSADTFENDYKLARAHLQACSMNELETLDTIMELAVDKKKVGAYVAEMKKAVGAVANANLAALDVHMKTVAAELGVKPASGALTDLEKKAAATVYKQTAKVKMNGYGGYREFIQQVRPQPAGRFRGGVEGIANPGELHLLINGKHSVLDIKRMLDAQYEEQSDLQAIFGYLEDLKKAGLIE